MKTKILILGLSSLFLFGCDYNKEFPKKLTRVYAKSGVQNNTFWLGIKTIQNPCDMWTLQEIINETRPDFIIETGTLFGGSAIFFAHALQNINENGKVITIDIEDYAQEAKKLKLWQDRIEFILGDSVSREVINKISGRIKGAKKVIVTLDSDHHTRHVLRELRLYSKFVTIGSYLIVQDTGLDKWGRKREFKKNGPMTAVKRFLEFNDDFIIDRTREKFILTWHPEGFLKRIK